jgi:hypothetical protein
MITKLCQRFTRRRQAWRPAGEVIDTMKYFVEPIGDDTTAKRFVLEHHYAASYPAARFRYGLFHVVDGLVGVAVYSQPWQHVLAAAGIPFDAGETLELSRFVLLDEVPANGESWFIGQTFHDLRDRGLSSVLSFSDPCPRDDQVGNRIFRGHIGTIYQATNGRFVGCSKGRVIHLLPDGQVLSDRVMTKIRRRERGWEYGVDLLMRFGAAVPTSNLRTWLTIWRERLCRKLHHPGNYRYTWALQRRLERWLPAGEAYPKVLLEAR